jgi:hypothetical protein
MSYLKELYKLFTNTKFFILMRELFSLRHAHFNTTKHYLSYLRSLNNCITRTKVNLTLEKHALLTLTMLLLSKFEPLI